MTGNCGKLMLNDMQSQAAAMDTVMEHFSLHADLLDRKEINSWFSGEILLTGCGATFALASTTAALYRKRAIRSSAIPASEIYFYPEVIPFGANTLIAFSRSGETSETLKAAERFRQQRQHGKVIAITANTGSSLALFSDRVLDCSGAGESSIIETKSFSGMFILAQLFVAWLQNDAAGMAGLRAIPQHLQSSGARITNAAEQVAHNRGIDRYIFLGGGSLFGIAYQASLTLKECVACWSEAFHPLEFRHGPRTTATGGAFICLFASTDESIALSEKWVVKEMKDQGASILVFTGKPFLFEELQENERFIIEQVEAADYISILTCLVFSQWLAYFKSLSLGLNPDQPANLKAVTRL